MVDTGEDEVGALVASRPLATATVPQLILHTLLEIDSQRVFQHREADHYYRSIKAQQRCLDQKLGVQEAIHQRAYKTQLRLVPAKCFIM